MNKRTLIIRSSYIFLLLLAVGFPLWTIYRIRTGFPLDDAFITFTYARNIARGMGFSYNGTPPFLGTTSPLLALLLALLGILFPSQEIYILGIWLSGILWAIGVALSYALGTSLGDRKAGLFLAFAYASHSLLPWVNGFEYTLLLALSILAITLTIRGYTGVAGLVLGFAFLARGDAALLAAVLGGTWLLLNKKIPWRMILGFLIPVVPWMIYGFWAFGNPLPATLKVKLAHRAIGAWPHIAKGFLNWFKNTSWGFQSYVYLAVGLSLVGIALSLYRRKWWHLAIIGWGSAYVIAYLIINVPFYFWYITPALTSLILFASLTSWDISVATIKQDEPKKYISYAFASVSILLYIFLVFTSTKNVISSIRLLQRVPPKLGAYKEAGIWLSENSPPGSTVSFIEVGVIGYFSDRPVLDILGLTYPEAIKYIKEKALHKFIEEIKPNYYVRNTNFDTWDMTKEIHKSKFFKEHYVKVASFPLSRKNDVIIYEYEENPGNSEKSKAPKKIPHSIWILGDSLTIGPHASSESNTYRNILISKIQSRYPGQIYSTLWTPVCTWAGLEKWWEEQSSYPDILFIELGLVDVIAKGKKIGHCIPTPQDEWAVRVGNVMDKILQSKSDIQVVVGTIPWAGWDKDSEFYKRAEILNSIIKEEARRRNIPVADLWSVTVGDRSILSRPDERSAFGPDFYGDSFHPGDKGHRRIAETFWKAYREAYGRR